MHLHGIWFLAHFDHARTNEVQPIEIGLSNIYTNIIGFDLPIYSQ